MVTGLQRLVRRAVLSALKANAPLIAVVPATRIYGQTVPMGAVFPFVRLGGPQTLPLHASCINGAGIVTLDVHAFVKPRLDASGNIAETAEDFAGRIGAAIEAALDRQRLPLEAFGFAALRLTEMRLLQDADEADAYHYFAQISARCIV